jgi:hypothetical protein
MSMSVFDPRLILVVLMSALLFGYLVIVARRRQNFAATSISMIAAAYGGIALASFFAVRSFGLAFQEAWHIGRGVDVLSRGIWQATLLPLAAAWATAILTSVALLLLLLPAKRDGAEQAQPKRSARLLLGVTGLAVAGGATAVVLFRQATVYAVRAVLPGLQPVIEEGTYADAVAARVFTASAGSVVCFVLAVALMSMTFRARRDQPSRAMLRVAAFALIVSLGVSAALIRDLSAYSGHYRGVLLHGGPMIPQDE